MSLTAAVEAAVAAAEESTPGAAASWQAELALSMARTIDGADSEESISARVSAGKLLAATMASLSTVAPPAKAASVLDQLADKRNRRRRKAS